MASDSIAAVANDPLSPRAQGGLRPKISMTEADPSRRQHPSRSFSYARVHEWLAHALSDAVADALPALADQLDAAADRALDGRDRQFLFVAATRLRREAATRVGHVAGALAGRAQRCIEASRRSDEPSTLTLVDADELEQQIAAGELGREVRERSGSVYPSYVARLRNVVDAAWEDDELNPLGARTLAAAALASLSGAAETAYVRDTLRHLAWKTFATPLAEAVEGAERLLEELGVSDEATEAEAADGPADDRDAAPSPPPEDAREPAPGADVTDVVLPAGEENAYSGDPGRAVGLAVQADHDASTLGTSPLAESRDGQRLRVVPTLQPVLDIERDAVAFAHAIGAMPYSRQARSEFFGNVRARLRDANASAAQVAVVDVVAAMFDYVIDDRRVPEAARPLVWRLQQPTIALALLDPAYLGDDPRSLRRLIEHFGAISTAFSDEIARGSELHRRLETVVRAVEIVTGALQARSAVMAQQVEKEYSRAARSVGQLIEHIVRERRSLEETPGRRNRRDYARRPSREREEQVTGELHAMLAERLQRHSAPESVRDFVMNVWLRHLRTAALRDGEHSAEFQVSLRVVDDLLWSLDDTGARRSRRELAQRIPPLIRLMTQGVREIGAKDEEFKSFFDELFLIHLRRMQRRERERGAASRTLGGSEGEDEGVATTLTAGGPSTAAGTTETFEPPPAPAPAPSGAPSAHEPGDAPSTHEPSGVSRAAPAATERTPPAAPQEGDAEGTDRRLLEILESLDLGDLAQPPVRCRLEPAQAIERLARGDWIELVARGGDSGHVKVAWINRRRTVVLLVRRADRRAMSLRIDELRERFDQGRAFLLER